MATSTLVKVLVKMNLNNGTDSQGNVKTVSVNLGSLNPTTYDADKALAIADKLEDILSKTIVSVNEVKTATIQLSDL